MKRVIGLFALVVAVMLVVTVTGCSPVVKESAEQSPSEVASLYLEAMRGNVSGLKAYNPDTELTEDGVFGSANASMLEQWGIIPTAEQEAQLTEAMLAGLSKVEFTALDEKVDGEKATVTTAIRGMDFSSSLETQFATIGGQITEDTEDADVVAILDKAWREAQLVPEPANVEMSFTAVSDGRWIADSKTAADVGAAYVVFKE